MSLEDRTSRMLRFATQHALDPTPSFVHCVDRTQSLMFQTSHDADLAEDALKDFRKNRLSAQPRTGVSKMFTSSNPQSHRPQDIALTLAKMVKDEGSSGGIQALVERLESCGGNINVIPPSRSTWKQLKKIDQEEQRPYLLVEATGLGNLDTVRVLASRTDQVGLDKALHMAIGLPPASNAALVEILLAYGANGATLPRLSFKYAVEHNEHSIVSYLFSAPKPVTQLCMTEGLLLAVEAGLLSMVFLLALSDADADAGMGSCVKVAIQSKRPDILTALTMCQKPPTANSLDQAMRLLFDDATSQNLLKKEFVEILLASGARGPGCDWSLSHVTDMCIEQSEPSSIAMLQLLVNSASLHSNNASALRAAVYANRVDLVDIFLTSAGFDSKLATIAFSAINPFAYPATKISLYEKLLAGGAEGIPLHEALIHDVEEEHTEAVEMLLLRSQSNRASVNFKDAMALQHAVFHGKISLVRLLLSASPLPTSVTKAFSSLRNCSKEDRVTLAGLLLQSGARGRLVDGALVYAVNDEGAMRDDRLIRLLIENGADVNFQDGQAIEGVIRAFDIPILDTLLNASNLDPRCLDAAFAASMNLSPPSRRHMACKKLLDAGMLGTQVSEALLVACSDETLLSFLEILLPNSDVNHDGGKALSMAIKNHLPRHTAALLSHRVNDTSFNNAFVTAISLRQGIDRIKFCRLLLEAAPRDEVASNALLLSTQAGHADLCDLMVQHSVSSDTNGGAPIVEATRSGNIHLLSSLLRNGGRPLEQATLEAGFQAALRIDDPINKFETVQLLLNAGLRGNVLDEALIQISGDGDNADTLATLLLKHGASVNAGNGDSLCTVVRLGARTITHALLFQGSPSRQTLSRAFGEAQGLDCSVRHYLLELIFQADFRKTETQAQIDESLLQVVCSAQNDIKTVEILLGYGASVRYKNHQCLISGATKSDIETFKVLLGSIEDPSAFTKVFASLFDVKDFWKSQDGIYRLELLLDKGASGSSLNRALKTAVTAFTKSDTQLLAEKLIKLLLGYGASLNFESGRALQLACEKGDPKLVSMLLTQKPEIKWISVQMAFPYLFVANVGKARVIEIIALLAPHLPPIIPSTFTHPAIPEPMVFLSIRRFPTSPEVLEAVLAAGYRVDEKMFHEIGAYGRTEMTALFWTLFLGEGSNEAVIEVLQKYGANVHGHLEPILHRAILKRYSKVVEKLVLAGIDVDLLDTNAKTALSLALSMGDLTSMKAILEVRVDQTDGTLHDAALLLNPDAVKILYGYGYDPNDASSRHGGRSPLAELCYRGPDPSIRLKSEQRIRKTMTALVKGGAHTDIKTVADDFEKSLLLLALDTREPYFMASALLSCDKGQQGTNVNANFNLFDNDQYTYSPIMYVAKGLWKGERDQQQTVMNLLRKWKVKRRFWCNSGEQPFDMIDAPPNIAAAELERKTYAKEKALKQRELDDALYFEEEAAERRLAIQDREREVEKKIQEDQVRTALALRQIETQGVLDQKKAEHDFDLKLKYAVHQVELKQIKDTHDEEARARQRQIEDKRKHKAIEDSASEKQITLLREQNRVMQTQNELGKTAMKAAKARLEYQQMVGSTGGAAPRFAGFIE